jgi:hypothetical protein
MVARRSARTSPHPAFIYAERPWCVLPAIHETSGVTLPGVAVSREQLAQPAGPVSRDFPAFFGVSHMVEYTFVL